ncbi:MAG TPA: DUF4349 domain-containing protein [Pseudonocardiaceae bacterium]|nr:DUF4349 domain-containing protein [Pseudonocardiaceae bacterium]
MRRAVLAGLAGGVLAVGVLVGCSAGPSNSAGDSAAGSAAGVGQMPRAAAPQQKEAGGSAASGRSGSAGQVTLPPTAQAGRQLIRSASITLTARNVQDAAARAAGIAAAAGGYTADEDADDSTATLTLQVPQGRMQQVLRDVGALGHVTGQGASAQDVTDQLVDVHSRIASQQASVDRVRALLARANSISDIVSIEGELTRRESDLESLEQRNAELTSQVALSAVTVHISRTPVSPPTRPEQRSGFLAGLGSGWHAFVAALGAALVVVGVVLPFALILGGPAAAVWWWLRRRHRAVPTPTPSTPAAG